MNARKIRIINKNRNGVVLSVRKGVDPITYSWKDFNEQFEIQDKVWAVLKPEFKEKLDEIDHKIMYLAMISMIQDRKPSLTDLAIVGQYTKDLQEFFNCSPADIIKLVQDKVKSIRGVEAFEQFMEEEERPTKRQPQEFPHASQPMSEVKGFEELKKKYGKTSKTDSRKI